MVYVELRIVSTVHLKKTVKPQDEIGSIPFGLNVSLLICISGKQNGSSGLLQSNLYYHGEGVCPF